MKRQRRVLEDRVQAVAVKGRRPCAREGIGRGDDEQQKGNGDGCLHRKHVGAQLAWKIAAKGGHRGAEQRQYQHP